MRFPTVMRDLETFQLIPGPSHPIAEVRGTLCGKQAVWYEYVPDSHPEKMPLVLELHGGNSDALDCIPYNAWYHVADKYGFLVVYPTSPNFLRWNCDDADADFLLALIEQIKQDHNIDETRIYMEGMSNADMMTLAFVARHPNVLAGAGFMTGPTADSLFPDLSGEVPVVQMRGEKDLNAPPVNLPSDDHTDPADPYAAREHMNDYNRKKWLERNAVSLVPQIEVDEKDNYVWYPSDKFPVLYWEAADMGHRIPPEAPFTVWERLYSGYRREAGEIVACKPIRGIRPSGFAMAFGSNGIYKDGRVLRMEETPNPALRYLAPYTAPDNANTRAGESLTKPAPIAPVECLRLALGAEVQVYPMGKGARITANGITVEFVACSRWYSLNGEHRSFRRPAAYINGTFYVPIDEVLRAVFGLRVRITSGVLYADDREFTLTRGTARIIRETLGAD